MSGTIAFGGIGSGLDTEGIVTGLVKASSGQLDALKTRATSAHSAVSTLSDISTLLATLSKSVQALATDQDVRSFKATSSGSSVVASASGLASSGAYSVQVLSLAKEQRTYSNAFGSSTDALNQSGKLRLKVGSADAVDISIANGDSLDSITSKINSAGIRASASLFYDGTSYRLQLRGLDTGAANAISINELDGLNLGLSTAANTFQKAGDAKVKLDGFEVTRPTNQVQGAIAGVTLALTEETTSPVTVRIDSDPDALKTKLQSVVDGYNAIMKKIRTVSGYGTTAASVSALAGDSALRSITSRLSSAMLTRYGSGTYQTLGSIGLSVTRDGLLSLDSTKLSAAVAKDSASVTSLLSGTAANQSAGAMDALKTLVNAFTDAKTGTLVTRSDALTSRAKTLDDRASAEQTRLDKYAEQLRSQFTNMDSTVASNNSLMGYLSKL